MTFFGSTDGPDSGSAYGAATQSLIVGTAVTLNAVRVYTPDAGVYTLTVNSTLFDTVTAPGGTDVTFTPAAPVPLAAGTHTVTLTPSGTARVRYQSPAAGVIGPMVTLESWTQFSASNYMPWALDLDGLEDLYGLFSGTTTGSVGPTSTVTMSVTDVEVTITRFYVNARAATTYTLSYGGVTYGTVSTTANRVAEMILASPLVLGQGQHVLTIQTPAPVTTSVHQASSMVLDEEGQLVLGSYSWSGSYVPVIGFKATLSTLAEWKTWTLTGQRVALSDQTPDVEVFGYTPWLHGDQGGGGPAVPTDGQIWPRGSKAGVEVA